MVTLMGNMVSPFEENKMMEKKGNDVLEQAASMMLAISITFSLFDKMFLSVAPSSFSFLCSMEGAMAVAWAHQDYSRPLDLTKQQAEKIRQLRGQLTESEKKL